MINIVNKVDCCGCEACYNACPNESIRMKSDEEGFLYPQVNQDTCVNCGLCEKVCPISNCETKKNENQVAYLLQYKDDEVCKESTSGGAFTGIASYVIEKGGIVFGVEMTEEYKVRHVPSRNNSRVARAPQSFWLDDILSAHEKMLTKGITNCIDSCTMMQECGFNLHLVDGPGENIKITTPEDFYTMRAILEAKENAQIYGFDE